MATGLVQLGRVFCLITGASRGFGRGLAVAISSEFKAGSVLLLIARNEQHLIELKNEIDEKKNGITVIVKAFDLEKADYEAFKALIRSTLNECGKTTNDFDTSLIIHNAGTLGTITKSTLDVEDIDELRNYYEMNLFSAILLNTAFFKIFPEKSVKKQIVVNITSASAVTPFKSWNYYSTGKAAREMFFKVLGAEFPEIRVLTYSPGPMKTDMMDRAREDTADPELHQRLLKMKDEDQLLEVEYSVEKLILLLATDKYKNGVRVHVKDPIA